MTNPDAAPKPLAPPRFAFPALPRVVRVALLTVPPAPVRTRRKAARGRAAVLVGAAAFMLMQAGLNLAIRNDVIPVRDPVFTEKWDLLRTHAAFFAEAHDKPRVLAVGSSRTQLAFDARGAESLAPLTAFNFGCPAAGPMTSALYLKRALDAGAKPDFVLVEIHPGFASELPSPYEGRWLHGYRLTPDEVTAVRGYGWDLATPPHHGWKGWLSASYAFRYAILNRYATSFLLCPYGLTLGTKVDGSGFVAGPDLPPRLKPRALERTHAEYAPTFPDWRAGGPGVAALRDTLTRCRERGIRAAVVLMPESSEYRAWYGDDGYQRVGELASTLANEFGVPAVDAREWVPDPQFADGHHLTADGAATYTHRLTRDFLAGWTSRKAGRE